MYLWLIIIFLVCSYFYVTRKFNYWKKRGIVFDKPTPYIGNSSLILFKHSFGTYFRELYEKFDAPLVGFFLFDQPQLVVKDPEIIKSILIENFHNFDNRTVTPDIKHDPVGSKVLFVLKNPQWKIVRQKMTFAFTSSKMKLMLPLIAEVANDMLIYLKKNSSIPMNAKDLSLRYTTDVIASCAFGTKAYSFGQENSVFHDMALNLTRFTWKRAIQMSCCFFSPFLVKLFKMKIVDPYSCKQMENIFWKVVDERCKSSIKRNDLVDILIAIREDERENKEVLFDEDLVTAQAVQFFAAGYESTSTTACFAMYELSKHPNIQTKLRNEIFGAIETFSGLTYEGIQNMKYLDMVVHETIRKYPILPFLDRRARSDYLIPGTNITIEKGMAVFVPTLGLHYDSNYYPDPEKFDPERFTTENKLSRPNCVYMGFGEGPRNCIGVRFGLISLKLLLSYVLLDYEICPCEDAPSRIKFDPKGTILTPTVPVKLQFKKLVNKK